MNYSMIYIFFICFLIQNTATTQCTVGQWWTGSNCQACNSIWMCPGDDKEYECPQGYYQPTDTSGSSCTACQAGYSTRLGSNSNAAATDCVACQAGQISGNSGTAVAGYTPITCLGCPPGTNNTATGQSTCSSCPKGTYSEGGSATCNACPTGTVNPSTGGASQSACSACPIGKYPATDQTSCIVCAAGTYGDPAGSGTCLNCPLNTYNTNTGSASVSACVACDSGTVAVAGATSCTTCQAGSYAQASTGTCASCAIGSYSSAAKATSCTLSPAGSCITTTGATSYTSCAAGTYYSTTGCSSGCTACPAGNYCPLGSINPTNCSPGYCNGATSGTSATSCLACAAGQYVSTSGASACLPCPAGTYTSSTATTSCTLCPVGTYSILTGGSALSSCLPCPAGNFSNLTGQTSCTPCPVRNYQNLTGQTSCLPCPVGSYNAATGQANCILCLPGLWQNITGQLTCFVCPKGMVQPLFGQTACVNCTPGLYQNFVGQAKCFTCNPGTFSSANASYACTQCPIGYYQSLSNQSACPACPAGSYQPNSGQSSCILCPPGTYQNKIAQSVSCINCPAGYVNPMWGGNLTTSCHQCTGPSYQYFSGQANCINCTGNYCGSCQFNDRTLCSNLTGVCWVNFNNFNISIPLNTSACLKAVAPICYGIWKTSNQSDPQCLNFVQYFDFSQMMTKVGLTAAILSSDGLYLNVIFDKPVWTTDFTDCTTVFSQDTLNWLPAGKTCTWFNSTMLQVDFVAANGVPPTITIMPNTFKFNYLYCQEYAWATTVPVTLPPPKMSVVIAGLTMISECDTLELLANLASPSLYPLNFAWNISFITVGKLISTQALAAANNYFQTYSTFGGLTPITISSSYYRRDSTLNVTLLATGATVVTDVISKSVIVNIMGDIPKIKFSSKSQAVTTLPSDQKSVLALQIANKRCTRASRRLLQSDNGGSLIPISITFQVFSGTTVDIMTKGTLEQKLEGVINQMYSNYLILSIDKSQGFLYSRYYKIMAVVTALDSGQSNNDTYMFTFSKPSITSVIDPVGSIVSISSTVFLNGGNSSFPASQGEMMSYKWACLSCTSLSSPGPCTCPTLSKAKVSVAKLILSGNSLVNLCDYVFSLTIATSGSGKGRTDSSQVEFITFQAPIRPVTGRIIQGNSNKYKDIYFTFFLSFAGPDSLLQYNWTLVQIQSFDPNSTDFYCEKNAFVASFLKNLGVANYSSGIPDIPIPAAMKPKYLTPTTKRFLGIDKMTLISKYQYTFGVVVTYPDYPSFVYVTFTAPQLPRQRLLTITPTTGVGFSTAFSIVYLLPLITDIDNANYQIYRKDCPSNPKSAAKSLTQVMGQSNLFATTLAPGDPKCKYQVEIVLRSIEFGDFGEQSVFATVTPQPTPASKVISTQLAGLIANSQSLTVDQTITSLSSLSSVNQTEQSTETTQSVSIMMSLVSTIDIPTGGALTLCDPSNKPKVLNTTTNILSSMVNNQAATIDVSTAGNISGKATNYLSIAKSIVGGTSMIPTIVTSLSGVADIGKTNQASPSFYNSHQQALGNMTSMKLNETQPGSPPYSVSSPSLEMVIQKNYTSAFDSPQNATSDKGNQLSMPGGLQSEINSVITKSSGQTNNTLSLGTSVSALSYNPFTNIKSSSVLNTSSFSNTTLPYGVTPTTMSSIYNDLSKGKLNNVVDNKAQDAAIVQVAFTPTQVQKNSSEAPAGNNIILSSLPAGQKAYYQFPTSSSNNSTDSNNTSMVPLFYNSVSKTWTNDGCAIENPFFSNSINVSCNQIGQPALKGGKVQYEAIAVSITVDILKNFLSVLEAGNYAALYSFGNFLTAPPTNWAVLGCVFLFFILVGLLTMRLNKIDIKVLHYERVRTLYAKYGIKRKEAEGFLSRVFGFLSNLKLAGAKSTFKKLQTAAQGKPEEPTKEVKVEARSKKRKHREYRTNGFNQLSWMEEKELVDLFYFYKENTYLFPEDQLFELMFPYIQENQVLKRLTQQRLEDIILENPSFCNILKVLKAFYLFI